MRIRTWVFFQVDLVKMWKMKTSGYDFLNVLESEKSDWELIFQKLTFFFLNVFGLYWVVLLLMFSLWP